MIVPKTVNSIEDLFTQVRSDYLDWQTGSEPPWFRGEPGCELPLVPKLYRPKKIGGGKHDENTLVQRFRMRAPAIAGAQETPPREHTDEWLFLAQHTWLPTRLLDWTEGLLIALHFALRKKHKSAVVWMLHPLALNRLSGQASGFGLAWLNLQSLPAKQWDIAHVGDEMLAQLRLDPCATLTSPIDEKATVIPVSTTTGFDSRGVLMIDREIIQCTEVVDGKFTGAKREENAVSHAKGSKVYNPNAIRDLFSTQVNLVNLNFQAAWGNDPRAGTYYPVAIQPTHTHPRMFMQKSCFTIQGHEEGGLSTLVGPEVLRQYLISPESLNDMRNDLRMAGITTTTVWADLDGLSSELADDD